MITEGQQPSEMKTARARQAQVGTAYEAFALLEPIFEMIGEVRMEELASSMALLISNSIRSHLLCLAGGVCTERDGPAEDDLPNDCEEYLLDLGLATADVALAMDREDRAVDNGVTAASDVAVLGICNACSAPALIVLAVFAGDGAPVRPSRLGTGATKSASTGSGRPADGPELRICRGGRGTPRSSWSKLAAKSLYRWKSCRETAPPRGRGPSESPRTVEVRDRVGKPPEPRSAVRAAALTERSPAGFAGRCSRGEALDLSKQTSSSAVLSANGD